jgi:inositol hexakisphosphate/diphosphoinositol-pentakisphosphate kinase
MYAEARKSPTLDGVVERDELGKEKRFPIILTPEEKFIAKKIVHEFGQEVCGFDLLRAYGKSYVCDVNGWSFVKGNPKYWTDCAKILQKLIFNKFFPHLIQ